VDETDIGRVRLGQRAQITLDAYPNRPFHGTVQKIASGATMQQNVVTYDVTIALENPQHLALSRAVPGSGGAAAGQLKPDMTATVSITVAHKRDVLAIPIDAVRPGAHGSSVTVITKDREGQPQFRPVNVTTGINDGEHIEILEGLKEGDVVVVSGQVPGTESQAQGPRFTPFGLGRGGGGRRGG
jgi:HlyD family secretion protein